MAEKYTDRPWYGRQTVHSKVEEATQKKRELDYLCEQLGQNARKLEDQLRRRELALQVREQLHQKARELEDQLRRHELALHLPEQLGQKAREIDEQLRPPDEREFILRWQLAPTIKELERLCKLVVQLAGELDKELYRITKAEASKLSQWSQELDCLHKKLDQKIYELADMCEELGQNAEESENLHNRLNHLAIQAEAIHKEQNQWKQKEISEWVKPFSKWIGTMIYKEMTHRLHDKQNEQGAIHNRLGQKMREFQDLQKMLDQTIEQLYSLLDQYLKFVRRRSYSASTQQYTIEKEGGNFGHVPESGYQLQFPKDALPGNIKMYVQHTHSDPLNRLPPEGERFVSGVLYIQPERDTLLRGERRASVRLEHCVNTCSIDADRSLGVGVAVVHEQGQYELVDESQVDKARSSSNSVFLWLTKLTSYYFGVVYKKTARVSVAYCGLLYREATLATSLRFKFIVVKDLTICIKAVKQGYENEPVVQTLYPKPVSFTPAWNMKLSLDLKREGVFIDGWKIIPVTFPAEIYEFDAYGFIPGNERWPVCELKASWKAPGITPGELNYSVELKGTEQPKSFLIDYDPAEKNMDHMGGQSSIYHRRRRPSIPGLHESPASKLGSMPNLAAQTTPFPTGETVFTPENASRLSRRWSFSHPDVQPDDETMLLKKCSSSPHVNYSYSPAPTLGELIKFEGRRNVVEEIGTKYRTLGTLLLKDRTGAIVDAIELKHHYTAESISFDILKRWIQGKGMRPVAWKTLVGVLRDIKMRTLADDIEAAKL